MTVIVVVALIVAVIVAFGLFVASDVLDLPAEPAAAPDRNEPGPFHAGTITSVRDEPDPYRFGGRAVPQFRIEYVDSEGVATERDVFVHWYGEADMECWCFLRDAKRTFRFKGIQSVLNLETGRTIEDLRRYLER